MSRHSESRALASPALMRALGAGSLTVDGLGQLTRAVHRRRVTVLEAVRRRPAVAEAGVSELISAWFDLLGKSPAGVEAVHDPFVGIWAEGVLRGERLPDEPGAVARLLAPQLDVELPLVRRVPTPGGLLHLPRFGGALRMAGADTAVVRLSGGRVEVDCANGRASVSHGRAETRGELAWLPARRLELGEGPVLRLTLGNDDPATPAIGPTAAAPLDDREYQKWKTVLGEAWGRIAAHHQSNTAAVAAVAALVVPQVAPRDDRHISSSNSDGFGVVGLSFTEDVPTLAVGLVHEARHALLSAALTAVDLHDSDPTPRFHAAWRDDLRPVGALLQGACAFAAVTAFWRVEHAVARDAEAGLRPAAEANRWWAGTRDALAQLKSSGQLTTLGRSFVDGLEELLGNEPAPDAMAVR